MPKVFQRMVRSLRMGFKISVRNGSTICEVVLGMLVVGQN